MQSDIMNKSIDPVVSIIVPIYNCEKYIEKCVNSILEQSFDDFELILVNDGSTDNTDVICRKYKDKRITYLTQSNKGVSVARNAGIKICRGKFITFIDADDWVDNRYLEMLVKAQKKFSSDITICPYKYIDIEGKEGKEVTPYTSEWGGNILISGKKAKIELTNKILANTGNRRALMSPYCRLYKKDTVLQNRIFFNKNLTIGEDVIFNLQYAQNVNTLCYLNKTLYYRTIHKQSAVMSYRPSIFDELIKLSKAYLKIRDKYNIRPSTESLFFYNKINDALGMYVFRHEGFESQKQRINKLYNLMVNKDIKYFWDKLSLVDLESNKDKIKFLLLKYHLVELWALARRFRHE